MGGGGRRRQRATLDEFGKRLDVVIGEAALHQQGPGNLSYERLAFRTAESWPSWFSVTRATCRSRSAAA